MTVATGIELSQSAIAEICRAHRVKELSLFGSAARGEMWPDSDYDLLVESLSDAPWSCRRFAGVANGRGSRPRFASTDRGYLQGVLTCRIARLRLSEIRRPVVSPKRARKVPSPETDRKPN